MKKKQKYKKAEKKYIISISILMLGNMFMYWFIKIFQDNPIYINSYIDDKIPFWGWMIYIYDIFYPLFLLSFYLLYNKDKEKYYKGIISCAIGCIICYIIYIYMPTIMYRPVTPEYGPLTNLILKITYFFDDPPLNCFPSIHCIFCFQIIISYIRTKFPLKEKTIIITLSLLIIFSTLFVKQHYIYDVISAFLIIIIANIIENIFKIYNKLKNLVNHYF